MTSPLHCTPFTGEFRDADGKVIGRVERQVSVPPGYYDVAWDATAGHEASFPRAVHVKTSIVGGVMPTYTVLPASMPSDTSSEHWLVGVDQLFFWVPPTKGMPINACLHCAATDKKLQRCSRCKAAYYCSTACQREHRKEHANICTRPSPRPYKCMLLTPPVNDNSDEMLQRWLLRVRRARGCTTATTPATRQDAIVALLSEHRFVHSDVTLLQLGGSLSGAEHNERVARPKNVRRWLLERADGVTDAQWAAHLEKQLAYYTQHFTELVQA